MIKNLIDFDHLNTVGEAARRAALCCAAMNSAPLFALLLLSLAPASAAAQPVTFKLENHVSQGRKPSLTVTARVRVSDLALDLSRTEDGGKVSAHHAALRSGQSVTFSIGEGTAGRAHYEGALTMKTPDGEWRSELHFETLVQTDLKVRYDYDHLDLERRTLRFQVSRPVASAEIDVIGDDGQAIGEGNASYSGEPDGAWLPITWTQREGNAMVLRLRVTDGAGFETRVELTPWALTVAHEEVNFATGSAVIESTERPKLDEALRTIVAAAERVKRFVRCRLYVSGHTDTVGSRDANRRLSLDRAQAIALYFKKKGLALPISYDGFGEEVQKVKTPDETDEPANRRVDYVLSARAPSGGAWREAR